MTTNITDILSDLTITPLTSLTTPPASFNITNSNYSYNTISAGGYTLPSVELNSNGINMQAGTDIFLGGKSLKRAIEKIEERLNILSVNPTLENDWEELKELGNRYRKLESEILEKMKTWEILKTE